MSGDDGVWKSVVMIGSDSGDLNDYYCYEMVMMMTRK